MSRHRNIAVLVTALVALLVPPVARADDRPWMDRALSPQARANALIEAMTLGEKIHMLHGWQLPGGYVGYVPAIERLGVPALKLADGRAGVGNGARNVTLLPSPIAASASFDTDLMKRYGAVLGDEQWRKGTNVVLGPTMDVLRVPQWGRSFESFGEDPLLNGRMAVADIQGIQSQGPIADANMYAAMNSETNRASQNMQVDERTLNEIYLPPFEASIRDGHVGTVMCAYVKTNGLYSCEQPYLLTDVLRDRWGFDGWVMSDWGATHSTVAAAKAGLDQEMPGGSFFGTPLEQAVENGLVSMATLDSRVRDVLVPMFRAGLFDRAQPGGWTDPVRTPEHDAFSRAVAEQGTVLLKNDDGLLPLRGVGSIAVLGAAGRDDPRYEGGGSSGVIAPYVVTPYDGIAERAGAGASVRYAPGASDDQIPAAAQLAKDSDVAVVVASTVESEGGDRPGLSLPEPQDKLISAVADANPNTIVVLDTGGPVVMPWIDKVKGVVQAWYPGQEDGNALAAVLFGDVNPGAKLPITFPRDAGDVPASTPEQFPGVNGTAVYSEKLKVGYRWYDAQGIRPLFPFGYGLSYTSFDVSDLSVTPAVTAWSPSGRDRGIDASVEVTNTGSRPGSEVVQFYVGHPAANDEPPRQLAGFAKVALQPGESRRVSVTLDRRAFSVYDVNAHDWIAPDGTYQVFAGTSSRDLPLHGTLRVTATPGSRSVQLDASAITRAGGAPQPVTATFTNAGDYPVSGVTLRLQAPSGWTTSATTPTNFPAVPPHGTVAGKWNVTVPADAAGSAKLSVRASYKAGGEERTSQDSATIDLPYSSLAQAFDTVDITDDTNPGPGNIDGAGYSYSAQALASVGLARGAQVTHGGVTFTWPDVDPGTPNGVIANGQRISLTGSGSTLGFAGTGIVWTGTIVDGTGTITYADGTKQQYTLSMPNWWANQATEGNEILATSPYENHPPGGFEGHPVSVYYAKVPLQAGKRVASVTLPSTGGSGNTLHLYAIAIGGPA